MYRQTLVAPCHRNFQRILWREDPSQELKHFRLTTLTYGISSASYLATKALQQLAIDEQKNFPLACQATLTDFYIDDLLSGAPSIPDGLELQAQLINLCKSGGSKIRKWSSNHPDLLKSVPEEDRATQLPFVIDRNQGIKALGVQWNPVTDTFSFTIDLSKTSVSTKRSVLSDIAKLFDPMGWLSPIIIVAKILMQRLWVQGLSWDEELPADLKQAWDDFRNSLKSLESLRLPRFIFPQSIKLQLHAFCDASEVAYAAVIFVVAIQEQYTSVNLLCSKTRVAPLKTVSLPHLELCGAVLLTRLLKTVIKSLNAPIDASHAWSDSTIVLTWISGEPHRWKAFVANRVSEIQDTLAPEFWHHVRSSDNPADCASRGLSATELIDHSLWFHGPAWLSSGEYPPSKREFDTHAFKDAKPLKSHTAVTCVDLTFMDRFSSFERLVTVTAFVLRFAKNCQASSQSRPRLTGPLSVKEFEASRNTLLRMVQSVHFSEELKDLKAAIPVSSKSRLRSLHPFLDPHGVLRVGGRLKNSSLQFTHKHPALLPHKSHFTQLIIKHEHLKHLHARPLLLLSVLRRQVWILNARHVIRQFVQKCMTCFRSQAKPTPQLMGDLPSHRLEPSRPFTNCGVDFGGPFALKLSKHRAGIKTYKGYLCLFVCMFSKAVHLELATDLSTDTFLAAFRRFVSRRGCPRNIYSDCGSNFVGASRELQAFRDQIHKDSAKLSTASALEGSQWHFIPPGSPHFGGIWEAGIKSAKGHLFSVLGNRVLTFEEFTTILAQVEACLNSRPLYPLSSDPNDLSVLTPGHFLIGDSLTAVPSPDLSSLNSGRRWQVVLQTSQEFWKRWRNEYLSQLQQRSKWQKPAVNLKPGDLVLLKDENLPPLKWSLARILETHPGSDGLVRTATIKTSTGVFKRPAIKLCLLPCDDSNDV